MERFKYPRTYHLPWSKGISSDDRFLEDLSNFIGKEVVVTEKMDGENATIYSDGYFHARSVDGNEHPSQSYIKRLLSKFYYQLPKGWRVCGENLYATHTIKYSELESYFQVFSIWDENNICLSWEDMLLITESLGLFPVKVIWSGKFSKKVLKGLKLDSYQSEGYVVRLAGSFCFDDFSRSVVKYVRANHVLQSEENWRTNWNSFKINSLKDTIYD